MKIGLIDVDGHNFPNLALMKLSAYHKSKGDDVEWWNAFNQYDIAYMSKIFSNDYTKDIPEPANAKRVVKGGTGYCISLVNGIEVYDKEKDKLLPEEIETTFPDYSIYPQYDYAVSMTSRGCPRGCKFCHVACKEGRKSVKVADVKDYWSGQSLIKVLDPNITACPDKRELFSQYKRTGAEIDFTQGLDIRLIDDDDIDDINEMRIKQIHFAWDNPRENLENKFAKFAERYRKKSDKGMVYILTNFDSSIDEDLYRVYTLKRLGFKPYVMIYDKTHADIEHRRLQGWCNNKILFNKTPRFEDVRWKGDTISVERERRGLGQITIDDLIARKE